MIRLKLNTNLKSPWDLSSSQVPSPTAPLRTDLLRLSNVPLLGKVQVVLSKFQLVPWRAELAVLTAVSASLGSHGLAPRAARKSSVLGNVMGMERSLYFHHVMNL